MPQSRFALRVIAVGASSILGMWLGAVVLALAAGAGGPNPTAYAEALPGGTPKLSLSAQSVTPTLTAPGNVPLTYTIRLVNTGAWTATTATLRDVFPAATTYITGRASSGTLLVAGGVLSWTGSIGFDSSVLITYSLQLSPAFTSGQIVNTAVLSQATMAAPISLTAATRVAATPVFTITKASSPPRPGPNKTLFYTLTIKNEGQAAVQLPITVTERLPLSVTLLSMSPGGVTHPLNSIITWTQPVTLALGETRDYTFSVKVGAVPSGTVISNTQYAVTGPGNTVAAGAPHTVTVIYPIFSLSKQTFPDPPGSNREMTYTLTLLNTGSDATNIVVTDRVPSGVAYVRGGALASGVVSWTWPSLQTNESAQFTYTVYISDVAGISIANGDYRACSSETICRNGAVVTSSVGGPRFVVSAWLDPIAKKPGGGKDSGPVTPTLTVRNLGPGNALAAQATLYFGNISVNASDLYVTPTVGTPPPFPDGPACDAVNVKCVSYVWVGPLGVGETLTFTTFSGQNTIGGAEGTVYSATLVITDSLVNTTTVPISGTAAGQVTHYANIQPVKSAPAVIGRGQLLTYTIDIRNVGLSANLPPILTDVVPLSVTFVSASDGGVSRTISNTTIVSWTLPAMSTGDQLQRTFTVRVNGNLVSGTQLVNDNYVAFGYGNVVTGALASGPAVTTTVREIGLVDSFKSVTPTLASPGPGNILTYVLHIFNSSELPLSGVVVTDVFPWKYSTYQRDAVTSSGQLISDIVSLRWTGNVGPLATERVTFTVLVDPDFKGALTNTAVITHPGLLSPVSVSAVAYVTDQPVLDISKSASPDPAQAKEDLTYILRVTNLGQQATGLVITDVLPASTHFITDSATPAGQVISNTVRWTWPVLKPGESVEVRYKVRINPGAVTLTNDRYGVTSAEGATALGKPLVTQVVGGGQLYLPLIQR